MKPTIAPPGPTIEPTEPEKEVRIIDRIINYVLPNPENAKIISAKSIHDYLSSAKLDLDEQGFIIDAETGEYREPYAYDREKFREADGPSDNPFKAYFSPQKEIHELIEDRDKKIHLTDLHSLYKFNDKIHPIKDDIFNLSRFGGDTGITFPIVTEWSSSIELILDPDKKEIYWGKESDEEIHLHCFGKNCGFSGPPKEWEIEGEKYDYPHTLICPQCSTKWNTRGVEKCEDCGTRRQFEDFEHGGYYGQPYCPDCSGHMEHGETINRYNATQQELLNHEN